MPTYRQILWRALILAGRQKSLWFFGLFAIALGSGGEFDIIRRNITLGESQGLIRDFLAGLVFGSQSGNLFSGLLLDLKTNPLSVIFSLLLLVSMLAAFLGIIWLIIVSQSALISGLINTVKNKKTSWQKNFSFGRQKFWPVFSINLINRFLFWLLAAALTSSVLLAVAPTTSLPFLLLFIILTSLLAVISFTARFAVLGVVLKNKNFRQAWSEAWSLWRRHWLVSLEIAGLIFLGFWLVNTFLVITISLGLFYSARWLYHLPWLIIIFNILALLLFVAGQIFLALFHWTTWSLAFEVLTSQKAFSSRIVNGLKRIFKQ